MGDTDSYSGQRSLLVQKSGNRSRGIEQVISAANEALPLKTATTEIDLLALLARGLTRVVYRAPKGYAFRMTGRFVVDSDQSDIAHWHGEISSLEELIESYRRIYAGIYDQLVGLANGDEETVIAFLSEGFDEPTLEKFLNYTPPNSGRHFRPPESFEGDTATVRALVDAEGSAAAELIVFGAVNVWQGGGFMPIELPIPRQSEKHPKAPEEYDNYLPEVRGDLEWERYYAEGKLGSCVVKLVQAEPLRGILTVKEDSDVKKLWLPPQHKSAGFYLEEVRSIRAMYGLEPLSAEQEERILRQERLRRRLDNQPFSDDPLRYFRIAQPEDIQRYSGEGVVPQIVLPEIDRWATRKSGFIMSTDIDAALRRFNGVK